MIACVYFVEFEAFLTEQGFVRDDETERTFIYVRGDEVVTARRPNVHGEITEQAINACCDAADLEPPRFDTHWSD